MKVVEGINPKGSPHEEKCVFFPISVNLHLFEMMKVH